MPLTRRFSNVYAVIAVAMSLAASRGASDGLVVRVDPPFGKHAGAVTVRMSSREVDVVDRVRQNIVESDGRAPLGSDEIEWKIEPSAMADRTLELSRRVLVGLQDVLQHQGWYTPARTTVVVARSQTFINRQLDALGCFPDLSRTNGLHLMGETVCGHKIIVINLTGYYFLRSASASLESWMETMPAPRVDSLNYRIAIRNISGLAHEWAHVARATVEDGQVGREEPAWFREGFAELMAGVGMVRAFPERVSYLDFHIVRLRKFTNWIPVCVAPLRAYRETSRFLGGCEYYVGPLAVEYLMARYGGLDKLFELFGRTSRGVDFFRAFRRTYGITVGEFESKAKGYIAGIRRIGTDVS